MALIHRSANAHKGNQGAVGVIGGAQGMVGAVFLAARAALFAGAGKVFVIRPDSDDPLRVDPLTPELMFIDSEQAKSKPINSWVLGPGLGISERAHHLTVGTLRQNAPVLVDADGLNLMAQDSSLIRQCARRTATTILTPHAGEAARLLARSIADIESNREASARALAQRFNAITVLKGKGSVIAEPAGTTYINPTGNAALATGGTGDVLAGVIGALIAQGLAPNNAVRDGVRLHGLAAERLTAQIGGVIGLTASELIREIRTLINTVPP
ncbi:MAG: hypothetical protein RL132_256 [Pseudomonadota bacterium]